MLHFVKHILVCTYIIFQYCQILMDCTISSESPFLLGCAYFCVILPHSIIMWLILSSLSPNNLIFVDRPTYARVWHMASFIVGTRRWTVAHTRPGVPKMPWASSAFPKKEHLRRQAINLAPPRVSTSADFCSSDMNASLNWLAPESRHTQSDLRIRQHDRSLSLPNGLSYNLIENLLLLFYWILSIFILV